MANIKSAKKRIVQTATRTERNRSIRSRIHTFIRKLEEIIANGKKADAQKEFTTTMSELHVAVKKGVMKKETASRKISRLNKKVKAM
ncbi:MAG: 30S ribosomal protein S20 [Alphaproteobacteria bacterium]